MKKLYILIATVIIAILFSSCATKTLIEKRNLNVQTKMSDSIFLEPVSPSEQIVYLKIRNTSDKDLDIQNDIKIAFEKKGFKITNDPKEANYMILANLLQIGKSNKNEASDALGSMFGGAIIGGGVSIISGRSVNTTNKVAIAGAALGFLGDAMIKDVYFTMITDVEIRQRVNSSDNIKQSSKLNITQGSSATQTQTIISNNVKWKKYRTRVVSVANKVNLEFNECKTQLINGLARSLSGLL